MNETALFERSEYRTRLERTRSAMRDRGVETLLLTDPANLNYLSGYDGWSFYVHQGLIVPLSGEPVWVGREMDANGARFTTILPDENIRSYPDEFVHSPTGKHPMDFVADVIADLDLEGDCIGVEMDGYYFTARAYERLRSGLPSATFRDATLLVNRVRHVKSSRELEYMRQAASLADQAMRAGLDMIDPGVRESAVAAEIYRTLVAGAGDYGGDYPAIVPLMPAGDHTGTPHLTWSDRRFERGDPVIIELAGCRHRYHAPLARTATVGEPRAETAETAEIVIEGLNAAIDAVGPGTTAAAVERAWRDAIAAYDVHKESRIGYAMGLGYPPDWGEHTTSLRPNDDTRLEPDMTFHIIPGIWFDDYGVEISETVRVTESGAEVLGDTPQRLFTA